MTLAIWRTDTPPSKGRRSNMVAGDDLARSADKKAAHVIGHQQALRVISIT